MSEKKNTGTGDKRIRLLFPVKKLEHGEQVQDILFANKEQDFDSVTFLHVVEEDMQSNPPYTSMEAIGRISDINKRKADARIYLNELAGRVGNFLPKATISTEVVTDDEIAELILSTSQKKNCNLLIMLADAASLNQGWFSTSTLKTIMKKAPSDLRVHVIRPAEAEGVNFGLKIV
jgi:hypothetical protein